MTEAFETTLRASSSESLGALADVMLVLHSVELIKLETILSSPQMKKSSVAVGRVGILSLTMSPTLCAGTPTAAPKRAHSSSRVSSV